MKNTIRSACRWLMRLTDPSFRHRGVGVFVSPTASIRNPESLSLGARCNVHDGVVLWPGAQQIQVGEDTDVGPYVAIYGQVTLGRFNMIGPHAMLAGGGHRFDRLDIPMRQQGDVVRGIIVADDVWVGANAVVVDGVTVGKGAIVGAGAVVTHDVAPYAIVAGVPARPIGSRRDQSTAD